MTIESDVKDLKDFKEHLSTKFGVFSEANAYWNNNVYKFLKMHIRKKGETIDDVLNDLENRITEKVVHKLRIPFLKKIELFSLFLMGFSIIFLISLLIFYNFFT